MAFSIDGVSHRFHEIGSCSDVMKTHKTGERRQRDQFKNHHAAFYLTEGGNGFRGCAA
ncbi:hypothetical protein [Rhizobium rhizogenes]|uniref:hypothetical protein n=1 Tax=Rhizobium rhizogenes TaxID=359 RepID=UPI000A930DBD|nr:hypothetical protein [Rhizobium rhizogenes]